MIIVVSILLVFVFGLPLLRLVLFFMSNGRAGKVRDVRGDCRGNVISAVCRVYVTSAICDILAPALYGFGLEQESMPAEEGPPILLVHGLYHNRSAWLVLRKRLERSGYQNIRAFTYGSWRNNLNAALALVREEVDRTLAANPGSKVLLVGHSLGGVLLRMVAGEDAFRDRIAALVTLGSPFGGSELAWLGAGKLARSLIPGREVCRELRTVKDTAAPRLAIISPMDDFIFPQSCLEPGAGWKKHMTIPHSHVWLLYSKESAEAIISFFGEVR